MVDQNSFRWGGHTLHPIWQKILPSQILNFALPTEKTADCMNCPKVRSHGFNPRIKCCTYHPKVPNYMLGFALKSESAARVEGLIKARYLLPEGSGHTPLQWFDVMSLNQSKEYGKSEKVVCRFLNKENGLCGIYEFRNSACSTYFCMYDNPWGENFWEKAHHLLGRVELALTQIALREIGFDFEAYLKRYNEVSKRAAQELCDIDNQSWLEEPYRYIWGEYAGRENELFVACSKAVDSLENPWERVKSEQLIEPNISEISAMEAQLTDDEEMLVDWERVESEFLNFAKRVEFK